MRRSFTCLVAVAAAGLTCGDADKAKNEFIAQFCDTLRPCCSAVELRDDGQFCRIAVAASLPPAYDETAGQACLQLVRSTSADPATCLPDPVSTGPCKSVFAPSGPRAPGETCTRDSDCMSPAEGEVFCASATGSGGQPVSKCQVVSPGQAGSTPCADPPGDVAPTLFSCRASDALRCEANACIALSVAGGPCTLTSDCIAYTYCDLATTCVTRKEPDAACIGADECRPDLYCSDATSTCVPRVEIGAPCTVSHECISDNCDGTTCRAGIDNLALIVLCGEV